MSMLQLSADGSLMTWMEPGPEPGPDGLDMTSIIPVQFQPMTEIPKLNPNPNPNPSGCLVDTEMMMEERRRVRRKISNRESARRSRMRKQQRLNELENRANQLGVMKQELLSRITALEHQRLLFLMDSQRLSLESDSLRRRLNDLTTILLLRRLPKITANSTITEPTLMPPLLNYVVEI